MLSTSTSGAILVGFEQTDKYDSRCIMYRDFNQKNLNGLDEVLVCIILYLQIVVINLFQN